MTDRPITQRTDLCMTGRPLHDLEAHDMSNQCINIILTWFHMELCHKTYTYII